MGDNNASLGLFKFELNVFDASSSSWHSNAKLVIRHPEIKQIWACSCSSGKCRRWQRGKWKYPDESERWKKPSRCISGHAYSSAKYLRSLLLINSRINLPFSTLMKYCFTSRILLQKSLCTKTESASLVLFCSSSFLSFWSLDFNAIFSVVLLRASIVVRSSLVCLKSADDLWKMCDKWRKLLDEQN